MPKPWYRKIFPSASVPEGAATTRDQANRGDVEAQFSLGLNFANGVGAAPDYAQAAQWYLKAAAQNHALAQFNLGMMHARGQGVPLDDAASVLWFQKAAALGDAGAQFHLGKRHHRASLRGMPGDLAEARIEAYKWFHLAAKQGYRGSDSARSTMVLCMSREDVTTARLRAGAFKKTGNEKEAQAE